MNYQPKKLLVTGGAGFIGSNFIELILSRYLDVKVVNIDKMSYAAGIANLAAVKSNPHYYFIKADINDRAVIDEVLREHRIDTVVHFAAESHVDRSISGPAAFIESNILGTFSLLEAVRTYWLHDLNYTAADCRFHHVSTDEVYGSLSYEQAPFTESSPYDPSSPYSASKASSDHLVTAYCRTYGLPVTLSHCSNNYGPKQHAEKLIPTVINACIERKTIPVYGRGDNVRDWIFVNDHCEAVDQIIRGGQLGQAYNVGGGNEWKNIDLIHYICEIMNSLYPWTQPYQHLIEFVEDRKGHDLRYAVSSNCLAAVMPVHYCSVQEKLPETVQWYIERRVGNFTDYSTHH